MKNQAIQYLALDVHQSTVVASLRDAEGNIIMRATVATNAKAILALIRSAGPRVHVAFEEGTQVQWLHDLIAPHAERVVVCNTRGREGHGNKSDRIDADRLSEQLRLGSLRSVFHGAKSVHTLKELVRNSSNLVEDCTRVMLRIKALFRARGILTQESRFTAPLTEQSGSNNSGAAHDCVRRRCSLSSMFCSSCGRRPKRR